MGELLKVEIMVMEGNGVAHFKCFRFEDNLIVNLKFFFLSN